MTKRFSNKFLILLILLLVFIFPLLIVSAASGPNLDYDPMETLPGFEKTADFSVFISNLYAFGIWTVGICALIMIVIGGYMYAASGGNNASMEKAKGFITDAIAGLILALLAYLILYIINPELVKIKMGSASTAPLPTPTPTTTPVTPPTTTGLTPTGKSACTTISNQQPQQCADASSKLNSLLQCINEKLKDQIQISSISDVGGVNCWQDHPEWLRQCNTDPTKGLVIVRNCCWHKKNSCHYGGTSGEGKSCAVDFSNRGSSATNTEIIQAATSCGAGYTKDEGNHVHASVSGCGCDN